MAFKLCTPHLRILKLEKLYSKVKRNHSSYCSNFCTSSKTTYFRNNDHLHEFVLFKNNSGVKGNIRFIHLSSSLYGKIVSYKLSDIGEGIVEVVIKEWLIKAGDTISQFDPICEVQSDKASVTITSRYDGVVKKLCYEVDETAKVGEPLINIELLQDVPDELYNARVTPDIGDQKTSELEDLKNHENNIHLQEKILASPAVRRLAKENDIDLQKIKGSGKSGQILKEDVLSYLNKANEKKSTETSLPSITISPSPDGQDIVEEIKGIKKAMVKSMTASLSIPLFSYCDEVDVGELVNFKDDLKRLSQSKGVKITFMPFFIKAASLALNKYPVINSSPDENCDKITIKSAHNIGVAIDTAHGLVVPCIKNVQKLGIIEIARELNRLQDVARKGQLSLEDLNGGTFTLSNIGIIGGTYTKPIPLPSEVIIGGIGKVQAIPRFDKQKNIVEAHVFRISWTADHRVLDGATVAKFSNLWKLYVEHPQLLLNL